MEPNRHVFQFACAETGNRYDDFIGLSGITHSGKTQQPELTARYVLAQQVVGYPLFKRTWNLDKAREKNVIKGDLWTLEFSYSQIAAYAAGHIVPPLQRVACAAEIWDDAEDPIDPHNFVQSLPIAATFVRLSNTAAWLPQPITFTANF